MADESSLDVTSLTVQLLSAYLSNNTVASDDLPGLIATTRAALSTSPVSEEPVVAQTYEPAVSVRKSLASRDHIISLIDGKPYKMLKRHLLSHGLSPAEYRARYNLPSDYPVVAPAYSEQRREVAKTLGLGRKAKAIEGAVETPDNPSVDTRPAVKATRKVKSSDAAGSSLVPETGSAKPAAKPRRATKAKAGPSAPTESGTVTESASSAMDAPQAPASEAKPKRASGAKAKAATPKAGSPTRGKKKPAAPKQAREVKAAAEMPTSDAGPEKVSKVSAKRGKDKVEAEPSAAVTKPARPRRTARVAEDVPAVTD